jgi:hypothetical protein
MAFAKNCNSQKDITSSKVTPAMQRYTRWNLLRVKSFDWGQNQFHPMYFFISPHSQLLLDMVFKSIWEMLFYKLHNMWKSKFQTPTCQTTTNEWVVIYNENPNELPKLVIHTLEKTISLLWYKQIPYIPWLLQVFKLILNSSMVTPMRKIQNNNLLMSKGKW